MIACHRDAACSVGENVQQLFFDPALHVATGTADAFEAEVGDLCGMGFFCCPLVFGEVGDDEAPFLFATNDLDFADDSP